MIVEDHHLELRAQRAQTLDQEIGNVVIVAASEKDSRRLQRIEHRRELQAKGTQNGHAAAEADRFLLIAEGNDIGVRKRTNRGVEIKNECSSHLRPASCGPPP